VDRPEGKHALAIASDTADEEQKKRHSTIWAEKAVKASCWQS
jgi:hypothetical protein